MSTDNSIPYPTETPWVTVPEAGRLLAGLSKNASYRAAKRGELPTVKVGSRYVVPTAKLRELLGLPMQSVDPEGVAADIRHELAQEHRRQTG